MNQERIEALAQTIEQSAHLPDEEIIYTPHDGLFTTILPEYFNLSVYFESDEHLCKTVGCIAGFCTALFPPRGGTGPNVDGYTYPAAVAEVLEIEEAHAWALCHPTFSSLVKDDDITRGRAHVTPKQAARAVRTLPLLSDEMSESEAMSILWRHVIKEQQGQFTDP